MSLQEIEPAVADLILDMASRIRQIDPKTFGFVMCDYFATKQGPLAIDPGLRPTGNTATILAKMFIEQELKDTAYWSSLFFVNSDKPATAFDTYVRPIDRLLGPDAAAREGRCVLPWGYNHVQGKGLFIAIAKVRSDLAAIVEDASRALLRIQH
jgi:hypothetical protein